MIRVVHPGFESRLRILIFHPFQIPDPGAKRHRIPDPQHCLNLDLKPEQDTQFNNATATNYNPPSIRAKAGSYLTRHIGVSAILADEAQVPEVVQPNTAVGRGHEDLVLAGHGFDAGDFAAGRVLPAVVAGRADMDGRVVFELVRAVEDASAVVGAHHCKLFHKRGGAPFVYILINFYKLSLASKKI